MLKVLLVDDEYYIAQGLQALIDWEDEGYEIAAVLSNGREALDYLRENKVDLVIADIMMPVMTGLELLETVQTQHISDAGFVILSGYSEFAFAQQALRFGCIDYLLKPIERDDLLTILRKFGNISKNNRLEEQYEHAYLARNLIALLFGKHDSINLDYIRTHLELSGSIRYIEIEISGLEDTDEGEDELHALQRGLYRACRQILKKDSDHCVFDVSLDRGSYGVGLIYCDDMAARKNCTEEQYIRQLSKNLSVSMQRELHFLVGRKVSDISEISQSYESVCVLKNLMAFRGQKTIYYYEEELQEQQENTVLCKKTLDDLIAAIERNEPDRIGEEVDKLFREMKRRMVTDNDINININYLLFRLIHLASSLDREANQEEILQFISAGSFEEGILRGSSSHLTRFSRQYADYLSQLRKKDSTGILRTIEKEIRDNYADNLTLQDLGKKYYINSSYLGQIFRKKYGQSFKSYLTNYRISEAGKQLIGTQKKINQIAKDVGYRDIDYFINKFIELKGCTPSRFRKNGGSGSPGGEISTA